jgi:hypothetical protein
VFAGKEGDDLIFVVEFVLNGDRMGVLFYELPDSCAVLLAERFVA